MIQLIVVPDNPQPYSLPEPIQDRIQPAPEVPTLAATMQLYLERKTLRESTRRQYRNYLRRAVSDWMGLKITAITEDMVEIRHQELQVRGKPMADQVMRILGAILRWGYRFYKLPVVVNPISRLSVIEAWSGATTRIDDYIAETDLPKWFAAVESLRAIRLAHYADWFLFMLLTGCRRGEAAYLEFSDLDFEGRLIYIGDPKRTEFRTKNGRPHYIPMSEYIYTLLKRRFEAKTKSEFVFACRTGPISHPGIGIKYVKSQSGVKFSCHSLRRTFCNALSHPTVDARERHIKAMLNHVEAGVTAKHYQARVHPEKLRPDIDRVTEYLLSFARRVSKDDSQQLQ